MKIVWSRITAINWIPRLKGCTRRHWQLSIQTLHDRRSHLPSHRFHFSSNWRDSEKEEKKKKASRRHAAFHRWLYIRIDFTMRKSAGAWVSTCRTIAIIMHRIRNSGVRLDSRRAEFNVKRMEVYVSWIRKSSNVQRSEYVKRSINRLNMGDEFLNRLSACWDTNRFFVLPTKSHLCETYMK